MKGFNAKEFKEDLIILENDKSLDELLELIYSNEDFKISWKEENKVITRVIIASDLLAKIKNNETRLMAENIFDLPEDD